MKHIRKIFKRDTLVVIMMIAMLLFTTIYMGHRYVNGMRVNNVIISIDELAVLREAMQFSIYFIMFFLIFSYYIADKLQQSSLFECAQVTRRGALALYFKKFRWLLAIDAGYLAIVFLFNLVALIITETASFTVILLVLAHILLYLFLPSVAMMLLGTLLAMRTKRAAAYWIIALVALLSSPLGETLFALVYDVTRVNLFPLYELIVLIPRRLNYGADLYQGGLSLLPDRFCAVVFQILLYGGLLVWLGTPRGKKSIKIACSACALLCVVTMTVSLLPASKARFMYNPESEELADSNYYSNYVKQTYTPRLSLPDFAVTSYDLDLSVGLQLSAKTTVTVDKTDLEQYEFTLYHGYKVKSVKDQDGKKLEFEQDTDFITVKTPSRTVTSLTFDYAGSSPRCYSNLQSIYLPAGFAYYPISGHRPVYLSAYYERYLTEEPVRFEASVSYPGTVYSNLDESGRNAFAGTSNGCTLVAGCYKKAEVYGVEVIYPYLQYTKESDLEKLDLALFERYYGEGLRRFVVLPGMGSIEFSLIDGDDGTFALEAINYDENLILDSLNREVKRPLSYVRGVYSRMANEFDIFKERFEAGDARYEIFVLYKQAVDKFGHETMRERVSDYTMNPEETRDAITYLRDVLTEEVGDGQDPSNEEG